MDAGLLILRVAVGALFAAHGAQKLFGWFGGHGVEGTTGFMASLRYRNPRMAAIGAGVVETGAGLLLAFGFLTPLAAAGILGVMINAIVTVKWSQGLFGGYELDALYAVSALALAFTGAGAFSIDGALGWDLGGIGWGVFALAISFAVGGLVLASRTVPVTVAAPDAVPEERRRAA